MAAQSKMPALLGELAQSLLAMSFNLSGLVAGGILAAFLDVFSIRPWTLALFPGILSVRGAIGGLFCGRLSTALHIGTVKASYANNTKSFYLLADSITVLTFESGITIGSGLFIVGMFLWEIPAWSYLEILAVVLGTMGLSLLLISPLTIQISFLSFRHRLDPDIIVYPVISTVADLMVTLSYIISLNVFFLAEMGRYLIYIIDLVFLLIVIRLLLKDFREKEFSRTLREVLMTLLVVTVIINITGSTLTRIRTVIGKRPEIYGVYPALIDTIGDVGSIVGSTATTKLFAGLIKPAFSSLKQHTTEVFSAWASSVIMFFIYTSIASLIYNVSFAGSLTLLAELMMTNVLAAFCMVLITHAIAILAFRHALNPDNFVIPIESSIADAITTVFLFTALSIFM